MSATKYKKRKTMAELAHAINEHLKRIEADPKLNKKRKSQDMDTRWLYCSGAGHSGSRVFVCYVSYQGQNSLTREEAEKYLAALDAGKVARHFEVFRETKKK